MNHWINSNSGDYITEENGQYKLHLLPRWVGEYGDYSKYLKYKSIPKWHHYAWDIIK